MSAAEQAKSPAVDAPSSSDPEEIREDIEQTRGELGETVTALAEKTDVKQQAQAKAEELKEQATDKAREAQRIAQENPMPMALAGMFIAGFLLGRLVSR
jgi:F0F1-type ATP synthase assembly protein I